MEFNPYREWLGLDTDGRRPDHYELLGLSRFEEDLELIRSAADARTNTVRHVRPGAQVEVWQRLLDELFQIRQCLTNPASKRAYDEQLRQGLIPNEVSTPLERAAVSNPLPPSLGPSPASAAPALESPLPPATSPVVMPTPYSPAEPVAAYSPVPHPSVPPAGSAPADVPLPSGVPGYFAPGYPAPPYGGFTGGAAGAMPAVGGYPPLAMAIPVAPALAPTVPAGMPAVPPGMPTLPPGMPPGGFMPAPYSPFSPPPGAGTVPHVPMNPGDPMAPVPGFMPGVYGGLPGYPSSVAPGNVLPVGGLPVGGVPGATAPGGLASGVTAIPSAAEPLGGLSAAPTVSASRTFVGRRRNQASLAISAIVCVVGVGVIVVLFGELQGRRTIDPVESRVAQGEPNPGIRPDAEITTPGVTKSPKMGPQRVVPARRPENGEPEPPVVPETPSDPAKPEEPAVKSEPKEPAPTPKPQPPNPEPSVPKPEPTPPTPEPMPQPPPAKKQPDVNEVAQMVSALGLAKTALGERRLDEAKAQIEIASNLAKAPNFKAMTHRMELLHHYVVEFWKAVRESLKTANTIDELEVGNTRVAIVSASEESLTIRAAGQNLTYETMSLPAGVAMALATRWLDVKAPSTKIIRGAFHAVDPKGGDPAQARRLWEEAKLLGGEVDELMPVLDDKFDLASLPASKATVRQGTVPTSETIAAAAKQVKEKYAKEISAAKNKEQKYALVKKLVEDAGVEMPNESYRYALLAEARDQSAAAKFAQLLVQVVDEMERWFKIDALEVKYESLSKAAATTTPGNARDFAIECLALTEKAIADKRYDLATKAAKVAHTTARRANDRDLAAKAADKAREIGELSGKPTKPLEKTKPNGKAKPMPKTPAANGAEKPPFAKQAT